MRIELKYCFLGLLFLLIQSVIVAGQYPFRFYSSKDGLQNKSVFSICEDHRGYIWFGTNDGGLYYLNSLGINSKYESGEFENATIRKLLYSIDKELFIGTEKGLFIDNGLVLSKIKFDTLNEIKVVDIFQDSKQNIWIGTTNSGLYLMKYDVLSKAHKNPIQIQNLSSESFFSICEDATGKIWAGGFGGGIEIITIENNLPKIKKPGFFLHKKEKLVTSLKNIGNNTILIGTYGGGVLRVEYDSSSYKLDSYLNSPQLSESIIWDIETNDSNRVWIATDKKGLIKVEGKNLLFYNTNNGLPSNQVLNLYISQRQVWIGTNGNGIGSLISAHIKFYKNEEITENKLITSIAKYDDSSVLIGTYGGGVYNLNFIDSLISNQHIKFLSPVKEKYVNTLFYAGNKEVYVGTANEGLYEINQNNFRLYSQEDGIPLNSINTVFKSADYRIWVGTNAGLSIISEKGVFNIDDKQEYALPNNEVQCITEDLYHRIWIGTLGGLSCIDNNNITNYNKSDGLLSERINSLNSDNKTIWIGTDGGGIFYIDLQTDSVRIKQYNGIAEEVPDILSVATVSDSILLLGTGRGLEVILIDSFMNVIKHELVNLNAGFSGGELIQNQIVILNPGLLVAASNQGLIKIDLDEILRTNQLSGKLYIEQIELPLQNDWTIDPNNLISWQHIPEKLKLKHYQNYISFQLASSNIINNINYSFEYRLMRNKNQAWLKCGEEGSITLNNLRYGKYQLQARIVDSNNNIVSKNLDYSFEIAPPFYFTWWFFVVALTLVVLLAYVVIKIREKKLIHRNIQLEETVQKRTQKIVEQKVIIEQKNKDITDSINYACKIQEALLPSEGALANNFKEFFILYLPRDIVSGDFYWILEKNNKTICILADCTGHGVPGAFMSMLGMSLLSEIVDKNEITSPEIILNRLREEIIRTLKQNDPTNPKDGMDLAVCVFDKSQMNVCYAGANSPVLIIRNQEIIELKGNRMPVAHYEDMYSFESTTLSLEKNDCIYMFTDGYIDQFGGDKGKKFMKKPLKRLLVEISNTKFSEHKSILENKLLEWMDGHEQVDDISLLGFKIE